MFDIFLTTPSLYNTFFQILYIVVKKPFTPSPLSPWRHLWTTPLLNFFYSFFHSPLHASIPFLLLLQSKIDLHRKYSAKNKPFSITESAHLLLRESWCVELSWSFFLSCPLLSLPLPLPLPLPPSSLSHSYLSLTPLFLLSLSPFLSVFLSFIFWKFIEQFSFINFTFYKWKRRKMNSLYVWILYVSKKIRKGTKKIRKDSKCWSRFVENNRESK